MSLASDKFNVLIVDDHAVVRAGFKAYLALSDNIGQVYETDRGEAVYQLYQQYSPHIVIMDLSMPGIGGLESIRRLLARVPKCNVLVFSIYDDAIYISRALNAGAKGYVFKGSSPDTLIQAVSQVATGNTFIDPAVADKLAITHITPAISEPLQALSSREFDIFCLLAQGMTTRDAAKQLCLSYKTVCNHTTALKEKLGLKTLAEFSLLAARQGLVHSPNITENIPIKPFTD